VLHTYFKNADSQGGYNVILLHFSLYICSYFRFRLLCIKVTMHITMCIMYDCCHLYLPSPGYLIFSIKSVTVSIKSVTVSC